MNDFVPSMFFLQKGIIDVYSGKEDAAAGRPWENGKLTNWAEYAIINGHRVFK